MNARTVVYDTGMLLGLWAANRWHSYCITRCGPHGTDLSLSAQSWLSPGGRTPKPYMPSANTLRTARFRRPAAQRSPSEVGVSLAGCVACAKTFTLDSYKRARAMLGKAVLPGKEQPDAVDALVVMTAALHAPAQILTSDPGDIAAYSATLDHADITVERI
jgi:hypothetical protein